MRLSSWVRLALLALFWGSSFLWLKLAVEALSPIQIAFGRLALGAAILLGFCLVRRIALPRRGRTWALLTLPALLGNAIPFVLFGIGEQTVSSSVAGVLNATTPLWAIAIAVMFSLERRPSWVQLGGVAVGFGGTVLILAPWESTGGTLIGAVVILIAAALYAVAYAITARYITGGTDENREKVAPTGLAASQLLIAAGMLAVTVPFAGLQPIHLTDATPLVAVAVLGVAGTGLAFLLNYRLIADEGATAATSVGYLLPVVSVLLGAVALAEPVSFRGVIGIALVLGGVFLSRHKGTPVGQTSGRTRRLAGTTVSHALRLNARLLETRVTDARSLQPRVLTTRTSEHQVLNAGSDSSDNWPSVRDSAVSRRTIEGTSAKG